ncbi:putative acid stress chaperone HdeA precursor [Caballeronia temeraria]|uniref:Acid stress chaperone HdeA n=2 Tax=Caballeronia TaxID=1827195 RepID=A0A158CVF5_9BURK|nr:MULTISPECIES: HdeA/HdeB family chaperone [Caballeronia]SAK86190.1 putative acid stress chaperone HdeA precursor [Caballeronia fortuita]SAK92208.1 putative acid stress chaperone HdeA precursor [Caballeronia temeraria]
MTLVKCIAASVCALAIGASTVARAAEQKIAPAKMTCADFVQVDEAYKPALVYWVAGVDKLGVTGTETTVVDTMQPVAATVAQECQKDPQTKFMTKVRSMIKSKQIALFDHH